MKKIVAILLTTVLMLSCFGMAVSAKVGDVIGQALHTDIVAYINNYAIPSYAVNGQSVIVAEDLRNFGFDVTWNNYNRSLTITRNSNTWINSMDFKKSGEFGKKFTNILRTDIKVYAGGRQITSYAMNGYTMIPIEELTMFGEVYWVAEQRAIKLWVNGVKIRSAMQQIEIEYPITTKTYGLIYGVCGSDGNVWETINMFSITSPLSYEIEHDAILYTKSPAQFSIDANSLIVYKVPSYFSMDNFQGSTYSYTKTLQRSVWNNYSSPFKFSLNPGNYLFEIDLGGNGTYVQVIVE